MSSLEHLFITKSSYGEKHSPKKKKKNSTVRVSVPRCHCVDGVVTLLTDRPKAIDGWMESAGATGGPKSSILWLCKREAALDRTRLMVDLANRIH